MTDADALAELREDVRVKLLDAEALAASAGTPRDTREARARRLSAEDAEVYRAQLRALAVLTGHAA